MERDKFIIDYTAWRCHNGLSSEPKIPYFKGVDFSIAKLWEAVQSEGGSRRVSECRRWKAIGRRFHPPPQMTTFSYRIKRIFAEHLLEYERSVDPGLAMLNPLENVKNGSAKRSSNLQTLIGDEQCLQVSRKLKKQPLSQSPSFDPAFPTLDVASFGQPQENSSSKKSLDDLTRAYVLCESLLKILHDAIESAKIKERKQQTANEHETRESHAVANDASAYGP